ncbi:glycoside hydrolase family 47 protein [Lentinula edodes]|uniref:alpha-1,2-Mannosidase n=1 Tax=Lentinula lateritia TaxID=40482 RepID=A0A9W9A654_9AGAR|nr:glycoside hydrolase family 47 protein [Lentinula edodes]
MLSSLLARNQYSSRIPSFREAFSLLAGRPLRWVPQLLGFLVVIWYFGPIIRGGPPDDYIYELPLPIQHPHLPPLYKPPTASANDWKLRSHQVREAFVHSYKGYRDHAFPADELAPMSGKIHNNFNGWGVTIYDALDTMWIMGLTEYFEEAVKVIGEASYTTKPKQYVPFFETIIRHLGGLLSAYALSKDPILLQQADRMGEMLLPAFNSESGLPAYAISTRTNATRGGWTGNTLWAEALSNQLEYKYLAHITGKPEYFEKAERCMQLMYEANVTDGIFPTQWNTKTGAPSNNKFSVGAFADSAHEYLLKQWLMTSRSETKIKDLYLNASKSIIEHLLYITPNREMLYVTDADMLKPSPPKPNASPESPKTTTQGATSIPSSVPSGTFEHLSCFLPGLLALGVQTLDLPESEKEIHSWAAEGLAYSCWLTYADMKTGLGPDVMSMKMYPKNEDGLWLPRVEKWKQQGRSGRPPGLREPGAASEKAGRDYTIYKRSYLLRPEALESFYIMWRTTGNPVWRERGWTIFQAIEKYAKTEIGYASIVDVDKSSTKAPVKDEMPSYFLAETLKYLYLLFTDEEIIPLDRWVFNTEAHPIPIFEWTETEKKLFNIS